jgi:phosphopantothenoylcysteine decarboxylase/phosphopantothenate--cysteine ligase
MLSNRLKGKLVVLAITGSIGAAESVRTIRELIRHGADVQCIMSKEAEELVHPEAIKFASGREVIRKVGGWVEHVSLFGKQGDADILVICPASANTISKIANGIADTPITLCATTALGAKKPVLIVPVMNVALAENPFVRENTGRLRDAGVEFFVPESQEGKLKIPEPEDIAVHVLRSLSGRPLARKRLLVVSGSTEERIDDVRVISNVSTGQTGLELAKEAYVQGAEVTMWIGRTHPTPAAYIPARRFSDVASLEEMCRKLKMDIAIVPAAISDFTPSKKDGKIPSDRERLTLQLEPTSKIIRKIKKTGAFTVGFKAESKVADETLVKRAIDRMREHNLDMMVANDVSAMTGSETTAHVISKDGSIAVFKGRKGDLAVFLIRKIIDATGKK